MKYKKVLCLNPYYKEATAAMGFFPPTGLEYVATAMESYVGEIILIDLRLESEYDNIAKLNEFIIREIDLVCVSINWSYYFKDVCDLVNLLPDDTPLVIGGQQATAHVEELFKTCPGITIIVRGEGEETIKEIAQGIDLQDILGISYKKNGQIVHNKNRPLQPVSVIAYPNRNFRRCTYYYTAKGLKLLRGKFDTILSARGCPFNCKFCTMDINPLGQKRNYSARTPESVLEELKEMDAEIILFSDDNFFVDYERAERICDLILEHDIKKRFIVQARLEIYKYPTLLRKAEKAGFKIMLIGVESAQDRILKQLDKNFTVEEVRDGFNVLKNYNFYYHCYFIYGNIGESREEMLQIPEFAREIGADSISYQKLQARAFSPLIKIVENTPGYHINRKCFVYSDRYSISDLNRIRNSIKRKFYTPATVFKSIRKLYRIRFFTPTDLYLYIFPQAPLLIYRLIAREIELMREKAKRRKQKIAEQSK